MAYTRKKIQSEIGWSNESSIPVRGAHGRRNLFASALNKCGVADGSHANIYTLRIHDAKLWAYGRTAADT